MMKTFVVLGARVVNMIDDRGRNRGLALEEIKWHCRLFMDYTID